MNIGYLELRRRLTVVFRLCGHDSGGPSGVADQSRPRARAPHSPPSERTSSIDPAERKPYSC
jgi:hypothetical protein